MRTTPRPPFGAEALARWLPEAEEPTGEGMGEEQEMCDGKCSRGAEGYTNPHLLVIAGIILLLLSIAGQLAGRIAVPPERQRWAAIMGGILLLSAVALYVVPPARLIPPGPREVLPPISPESATKEKPLPRIEKIQIPSLNARLTALRFFEGHPCEVPPLEQRAYRQRFAKAITLNILTEITLEHPKHERLLDFTI